MVYINKKKKKLFYQVKSTNVMIKKNVKKEFQSLQIKSINNYSSIYNVLNQSIINKLMEKFFKNNVRIKRKLSL